MPQAPSYLQAMFEDDSAAFAVLANNFNDTGGLLRPKPGYTPTSSDYHAIDYLCLEWDYGYEEAPPSGFSSRGARSDEKTSSIFPSAPAAKYDE